MPISQDEEVDIFNQGSHMCGFCRFRADKYREKCRCHRYPPYLRLEKKTLGKFNSFPLVSVYDVCGEFELGKWEAGIAVEDELTSAVPLQAPESPVEA